jgi:DNA-binding response OmpR family regulator
MTHSQVANHEIAFGSAISGLIFDRCGVTLDLTGKILLVEDQLLIAMDAEAILNDHGYRHVETATNLDDARKLVDQNDLALAILDINLGGVTSFALAKELVARNIPVAFASGYPDNDAKDFDLGHIPVISKPFGENELLDIVSRLIGKA